MKKLMKYILILVIVFFILYIVLFRVRISDDSNVTYYYLDYKTTQYDDGLESGRWIKYKVDFTEDDQERIKNVLNKKLILPNFFQHVIRICHPHINNECFHDINTDEYVYFEINSNDNNYNLYPELKRSPTIQGWISDLSGEAIIFLEKYGYITINGKDLKDLLDIMDKYLNSNDSIEIGPVF